MNERIKNIIAESIDTKKKIPIEEIGIACNNIIHSLNSGGKVMVAGNGGSAGDSQHMAGEFINRFNFDRRPLPCIALSTDS